MEDFTRKLMSHYYRLLPDSYAEVDAVSKAITRAVDVGAPDYKVGLWPLISDAEPEVALGVMSVLGWLLERWQRVVVYRLFVNVEGDPPTDYVWTIDQSQFGIDDWELDDLDENVAIWGKLTQTEGGQWSLTLEVEDDFSDDDEARQYNYTARDLSNLLVQLIDAAEVIATSVGATVIGRVAPVFTSVGGDTDTLKSLLKHTFEWQRGLLLHLWGVEWRTDDAKALLERLRAEAEHIEGDFGDWLVSRAVAQAMSPVYTDINSFLVEQVSVLNTSFSHSQVVRLALAEGVYRLGRDNQAYDLLDAAVVAFPDDPSVRVALAETYRRSGQLEDFIDVLQEAINDEVTSWALYLLYADALMAFRQRDMIPAEFVLLEDGVGRSPKALRREAQIAYQAVLAAQPANIEALHRQLIVLTELEDLGLWKQFEHLTTLDKTGEHVRELIDAFQAVDDLSPLCEILENAVKREPERLDLRVSLASAYLLDERNEKALDELEAAEELADDSETLAEIERLMLTANDPEFEMRLGEIMSMLDAETGVGNADIEYLESALDDAPSFLQGYLLLGRAYLQRGSTSDALETLLDAQEIYPHDAEVVEMLARVLWESGETELAFDHLEKGLAHNPNSIPLLALTGLYLFEDKQTEAAKDFIARAEARAPQHPALLAVKRQIVNLMGD